MERAGHCYRGHFRSLNMVLNSLVSLLLFSLGFTFSPPVQSDGGDATSDWQAWWSKDATGSSWHYYYEPEATRSKEHRY